ncbi:YbhN family protein [Stenotrophomonas sp. SY1]|uniref:lysylphosphatidylglycerol synthase transmembrane domain-containing protein n=1 Tax=Stenotrophomonas sp. SY1 TaxID=477235 RepID=UPI001E4C5873|nr:YbhN family protein [Stenotrophomonas sp. SY1]MCD9086158.1 flippase-like domain-containing protein [Stenotrophomonas sp. SY1]
MKLAWRLLSLLAATVLTGYFFWFCWKHLDLSLLKATLSDASTIIALALASLCYAMIYPLSGVAWRQLLLRQGHKHDSIQLSSLMGATQLAKYIPGNVAQHICRVTLSLKQGIPMPAYAGTVIQETILAAAASILVGALLLAPNAWRPEISGHMPLVLVALLASCTGILLLCIDVPTKNLSTNGRFDKLLYWMGGLPGPITTFKALSAYCLNYLAIGLGIWLLALAIGVDGNISYAVATSSFAIAWILGFLAPGAPAGLGAREGIMLLILKGHGSNDQIIQLVMLARASSMLGDLLAFAVSILILRTRRSHQPTPP